MIITRNTSTTPEALRETMSTTQSMFRVAAIQMASGPHVAANLQEAARLIELAASTGARIVALPEYFPIMGMKDTDKVGVREREGDGPIQAFLSAEARRHKIWIVGGTLPLVADSPEKVRNTCLVYDQEGNRVARYDKIHLFGFEMGQERYSEERTIEPGKAVCVADSPYGPPRHLGLLRPAVPGTLSGHGRRGPDLRAFRLHRDHRQGPIGTPWSGRGRSRTWPTSWLPPRAATT
jgi:nitrilase